MRSDGFPERKLVFRFSAVDAHATYLEQRWQQGCHNASQLWREMQQQGFRGQASIVRNWLRQRNCLGFEIWLLKAEMYSSAHKQSPLISGANWMPVHHRSQRRYRL